MPIDIIQLIQTLGGLVSGFGFGMFTKSGRVKAQAEAYKALADGYEARIAALHENIRILNQTNIEQSQRISELNHALDDKTDVIRKGNQKIWDAEQETNRVNSQLVNAQREIADLRVELVKFKAWHCRNADCSNRIPPNPALIGQKYQDQ